MSLVAFAIRLSMTRALRGKTWAGDRVLNAPYEPIQNILDDGAPSKPLIAIYTGGIRHNPTGKEIVSDPARIELTWQIYVADTVNLDADGATVPIIKGHAGAAAAIDFVYRQAVRVLMLDDGPWAKLFRRFVAHVEDIRSQPILMEVEPSLRIGVREFVWNVQAVGDPPLGQPAAYDWNDLLVLMEQTDELEELAPLVRSLIEEPAGLPDWRLAMAALGLSDEAARSGTGLPPQDDTETGDAAELGEVSIDGSLEDSYPFTFMGERPVEEDDIP
jgi:hypothetical protein